MLENWKLEDSKLVCLCVPQSWNLSSVDWRHFFYVAREGESYGNWDGGEAYRCVLGQMHH